MSKQYVALARVSSREQEREGFSLDVQEDALRRYAEHQGGEIVKLYRIAETASKRDERVTFKALLAYAKENAAGLAGVLFYKVDRAARNIFDYVELERLEADHGVQVVYVAQPTENTPAGRMQRRILSNMASFYTEQQSLDVKEGHARRIQSGLFLGQAPYGYRNLRVEGRGLVEIHPVEAPKVKRAFELYAYHSHTLDSLAQALATEGVCYTDACPRFPRSKLYAILRDRCYIGEVRYRGQWLPGKQPPLVDRATFDRVQALLGGKTYRAHQLTYAGGLITCGECGHLITGERVTKRVKDGEREHVYYRCTHYTASGHPRTRLTEAALDAQVLALFGKMKVQDEKVRAWIIRVLRERAKARQNESRDRRAALQAQLAKLQGQQDRLLNLRLLEEIEAETYAAKALELRDRLAHLKLDLEACDRGQDEHADLAVKTFELSQRLAEKWLTADFNAKRQILTIILLNAKLVGVTLLPTMRKPFDVLAEGLVVRNGRGDWTPFDRFCQEVRGLPPDVARLILAAA